jgi:glycosyltransferase involved in cell wall biosynthesis
MRIAHVTATFPPHYTGTGVVCYHQARGLARLGHEVTVYTVEERGGRPVAADGFTVRRLPAAFRMGNAPFLPGLLRLEGYDIMHLHHPFIFGAEMVWWASRRRGMPYVLSHHNDLIGEGWRRPLFDAYAAVWARRLVDGASKLAVVSLDHAGACRLAPLLRRRWADVVEVPNGVDTERFRPDVDGRPVRQRLSIPDKGLVLVFVGALDRAHHYRRVDLLLKAVSVVRDRRPYLLIVGDGDRRDGYEALAAALGLGARVRFLGSIEHGQLPEVYAAADVLVLPSQHQESFGLVAIEAMACGKPVVASELPGVRSVVDHDENGLLVPPGDAKELAGAIAVLLDDAARRTVMGCRGWAKVAERYAWPRVVRRLEEVYWRSLGVGPATGGWGSILPYES